MSEWILINIFLFGLSCGWFMHKIAFSLTKRSA